MSVPSRSRNTARNPLTPPAPGSARARRSGTSLRPASAGRAGPVRPGRARPRVARPLGVASARPSGPSGPASSATTRRRQRRTGERASTHGRLSRLEPPDATRGAHRCEPPCSSLELLRIERQHAQNRNRLHRALGVVVEGEGRIEGCKSELVGAEGARQRVLHTGRDEIASPYHASGLRAPEQLVSAEEDDARACRKPIGDSWLRGQSPRREIGEETAAYVVQIWNAGLCGERGESRRLGRSDEAPLLEV